MLLRKIKSWQPYQNRERWLMRNGASYHLGEKITPGRFFALRFLLMLPGMVVFQRFGTLSAVVAGMVFFEVPVLLVLYMNHSDNLKMLSELKLVYHALEIQVRAGVYITDALAECYGVVREKRFRKALLDLAGDILMRSNVSEAITDFQNKFDNRYIDSLCMIVLQTLESGQALDLLSDLSEQIKDMEEAVLAGKKESLDRSITFYQLGILAAVLVVVLYTCVTKMFASALHF